MRFQVPQFIDVEDKVFGPFTFKQFIYLGGGVGICFVLLRVLPMFLAIIVIIPVVVFSLLLAFRRVNNQSFINLVEAFFRYITGARLYLWKRAEQTKQSPGAELAQSYMRLQMSKPEGSKLKDLTWKLDVRKGDEE